MDYFTCCGEGTNPVRVLAVVRVDVAVVEVHVPTAGSVIFGAGPVPFSCKYILIAKHRSYKLIDFGFILGHKHKFAQCRQVPHGCIFNSVVFKRTGFIGSGSFGGRGADSSLSVLDTCKGFKDYIGVFLTVEGIVESLVTTAVVFQATQVCAVAAPFEGFRTVGGDTVAFGDNELVAFGT